jgi:hypothetical protein
MIHVPYKGGAPALTDVMGGQVQLMWGTMPLTLTQIRAGKVKALAVTSAKALFATDRNADDRRGRRARRRNQHVVGHTRAGRSARRYRYAPE